jgi:hypothetical protein
MSKPSSNPNHATVRSTPIRGKTVAESLSTLDNVCSAGAQSADVQGSPIAKQALAALQTAVTTAHTGLTTRQQLATALIAAIKALHIDIGVVRTALVTYESVVNGVANGSAAVINKAGLLTRTPKPAVKTALGKVSVVHTKVGKHPAEGIISWPPGPGATNGYGIEVNYTPQTPAGPWVALTSGTGRRRVVKAPTPGAQILARVASLGAGGTQSDWSDPVLVTTL